MRLALAVRFAAAACDAFFLKSDGPSASPRKRRTSPVDAPSSYPFTASVTRIRGWAIRRFDSTADPRPPVKTTTSITPMRISQRGGPGLQSASMKRQLSALLILGISLTAATSIQARLNPRAADLQVGDMAPDFALKASDGKTYKLSDFRGKQAVVIAWYPKAFTSGCTIECKSLAEKGDLIKQFDAKFFMASVDTPEQAKAFGESQGAHFPLLADPDKKVADAYGTLRDYGGSIGIVSQRWTFYIGKDGKILAIDKAVKPATSAEDVAAKLAALKIAEK
jgi:peroxiredoxin Q/BCP